MLGRTGQPYVCACARPERVYPRDAALGPDAAGHTRVMGAADFPVSLPLSPSKNLCHRWDLSSVFSAQDSLCVEDGGNHLAGFELSRTSRASARQTEEGRKATAALAAYRETPPAPCASA